MKPIDLEYVTLFDEYKEYINYNIETRRVSINDKISNEQLMMFIEKYYEIETKDMNEFFLLDIKYLSTDKLINVINYSLTYEKLRDPIMVLNIMNLIRPYNSLENEFFSNENIYVNSIEQLIDLKLGVSEKMTIVIKNICRYFLSMLKTYSKTMNSVSENYETVPPFYHMIFSSIDFMTLSTLLSIVDNININECNYIENSTYYIDKIVEQIKISSILMDMFLAKQEQNINEIGQ